MKIRLPWLVNRPHRTPESSPIPKAYRPWMMLSLAVLVFSLVTLVIVGALAFIYYANVLTPLWLTILGTLSAFGVALGFGGFFLMLVIAGYSSFKEDKIVPPAADDTDG